MSEVAIKVAVRVRPFSQREMEQNQRSIVRTMDNTSLIFDPDDDDEEFFFHGAKQTHRDITKRVKKKLTMEFDSVFNEDAINKDIFEKCMKPLVNKVMEGFNCSVFVYGATGAGKTFTMLGSEETLGLTFLTMRELFAQMDRLADDRRFDIGISYLEVYNELVMNLLTKSGPLKLREDSSGVVVGGLVLKQIHNAEELIELLHLGNRNRTQHPTDANAESSRSHAIFQVHIRMIDKKTSTKRTVKLSMIDLAGSERAQSTKCKGLRFKEGANINRSLLSLGNCINKLADGCKHIPYRDSNLTRILKDSLGGNCQTLMIANVSPSSITYEDTYNTLKYASRAKKIRTVCRQNVVTTNMPKEFLFKKCNDQNAEIEKLKSEVERYKERTRMLENQLMDANAVVAAAAASSSLITPTHVVNEAGDGVNEKDLLNWHTKIDAVFADFKKMREKCYILQSTGKFLNLRVKFKEHYEQVKKILTLDGASLDMDLSKMDKTIEKFNKEAQFKGEELTRWTKRFGESKKILDNLKNEIKEAAYKKELESYVTMKEGEVENEKLSLKIDHMNKINNEYKIETEIMSNIISNACEVIQDNYLLLRSMNELDNETLEKYQKLVKMLQGQRSVKFADDENNLTTNITDENLANGDDHHYLESPSMISRKRANEAENNNQEEKKSKNDFQFLRPKALKSINFEALATPSTSQSQSVPFDMNATFDLDSALPILNERTNSLAPGSKYAPKMALLKVPSKSSTTPKFLINSKENGKKFPSSPSGRVKKTPRTPNRVLGSKAPASLANRPKLVKTAVKSSLVTTTSSDKLKAIKKSK